MDLSKIISISGKPGLFKIIAQTKNGVVVESLLDKKRFTAFATERMSNLEEISVFSDSEDIPLKDVFKNIYDKLEGKETISYKSKKEELSIFFKEAVPNYDQDKVYISDIKKIFQWYNLLLEKNMLTFEKEEQKKEKETETEKKSETKTKTKVVKNISGEKTKTKLTKNKSGIRKAKVNSKNK